VKILTFLNFKIKKIFSKIVQNFNIFYLENKKKFFQKNRENFNVF